MHVPTLQVEKLVEQLGPVAPGDDGSCPVRAVLPDGHCVQLGYMHFSRPCQEMSRAKAVAQRLFTGSTLL
jgi:hypothetical protein